MTQHLGGLHSVETPPAQALNYHSLQPRRDQALAETGTPGASGGRQTGDAPWPCPSFQFPDRDVLVIIPGIAPCPHDPGTDEHFRDQLLVLIYNAITQDS